MVALLKEHRDIELVPFHKVEKGIDYLAQAFDEILEPIYCGDKKRYLEKIQSHQDRTCEILQEDGKNVGVLVYKNELMNCLDQRNAFEIKSLFLTSPKVNSCRGLASQMLNRSFQIATEKGAEAIFVTVNSTVLASIQFFLKHAFLFMHREKSPYLNGTYEYTLSCTWRKSL